MMRAPPVALPVCGQRFCLLCDILVLQPSVTGHAKKGLTCDCDCVNFETFRKAPGLIKKCKKHKEKQAETSSKSRHPHTLLSRDLGLYNSSCRSPPP